MNEYEIIRYPISRKGTFDVGFIGRNKHHVIGLIEIDITKPRKMIRMLKQNGENISFYSWLIKIIGQTIFENKYIHAINYRKYKQIAFNEINISIPIEVDIENKKVPIAALLKNVETKSVNEIYEEIESYINNKLENSYVFRKTNDLVNKYNKIFFILPNWLRRIIWKYILSNAFRIKNTMGTVMVTSIGIAGHYSGWIIPKSMHNLCFAIGTIKEKPWIFNGIIEKRQILNMTILIDHDVVDGRPATRFIDKLIKNIETGYLIDK